MHSALGSETFGERIRRRRRENELSQRQLAALVGVDFTYLSKLENDQEGQSPGEELVLKLAVELDDDSEELLALAGKVPVDALRSLARKDAVFARFLRRLSSVAAADKRGRLRQVLESGAETNVGKLPELLAPLMERGGLVDAHIAATLEYPPAGGRESDVLICRVRTDYGTRQDEWLWGFVTDRSHRDRLRDRGSSLDDIQVLSPAAVGEQLEADEIVRRYDLLVRYRDGDDAFQQVSLDRLTDLSGISRPHEEDDEFPLVVLRAGFPPLSDRTRRIELSYRCPAPRADGFWFWTASSPTYVSTITVDARQLARDLHLTFTMALPDFVGRQEGVDGMFSVRVDRWVLPGHGVTLDWGAQSA